MDRLSHAERARELFVQGYNCAQSVFGAFCDVTGYSLPDAMRISSSFGAGMGRMREVCGACSSMFMVVGILYGYTDPPDVKRKGEQYAIVQELAARFKERNGTLICRELLKGLSVGTLPTPSERTEEYYKVRPCIRFIIDACNILDGFIEEKGLPEK